MACEHTKKKKTQKKNSYNIWLTFKYISAPSFRFQLKAMLAFSKVLFLIFGMVHNPAKPRLDKKLARISGVLRDISFEIKFKRRSRDKQFWKSTQYKINVRLKGREKYVNK